ncbi:MAG: hypothetical protein J5706_04585 [Elusimicrobiales bacterium]|nr:hypothetical protein [Elusimicrobiales bacterium]
MLTLNKTINGGTGGGGQSYSAGPGIDITSGGISLASDALQQVPQILPSGGRIARQGSDGGYFNLTSNGGATIGTSGLYRFSANVSNFALKTNTSTGIYGEGNNVQILANGATRVNTSGNATFVYGQTTAGAIMVSAYGSSGSVKVKKNNGSYEEIITESSYATSDTAGIVQPDNSTCEVVNGGILSVKPPTLTWHTADGGSTVSAPETSNAALTKVYINGLLAQPGEDYSITSEVITLSGAVSSGGKVVTEVYPSGGASVQDGGRSVNMTRTAAPENEEEPGEQPEEDPAEQGEER